MSEKAMRRKNAAKGAQNYILHGVQYSHAGPCAGDQSDQKIANERGSQQYCRRSYWRGPVVIGGSAVQKLAEISNGGARKKIA